MRRKAKSIPSVYKNASGAIDASILSKPTSRGIKAVLAQPGPRLLVRRFPLAAFLKRVLQQEMRFAIITSIPA